MFMKPHSAVALSLCALLAASPVLASPPPGKGKQGHQGQQGQQEDVRIDLRGPSVDIGRVRIVLGDNRQLIGPTSSLPPGIAKNFDSRLNARLPHYDGYEWKQIGTDVVLVAVATGIVYEILRNVLD